jgi:hypothetical protein
MRDPLGVTISDSNAAGGPATEAAVHVTRSGRSTRHRSPSKRYWDHRRTTTTIFRHFSVPVRRSD